MDYIGVQIVLYKSLDAGDGSSKDQTWIVSKLACIIVNIV